MKIDDDVQILIDKINTGKLVNYLPSIDDSDFGVFIPTYVDGDTVKLMMDGYSQSETNLRVTVEKAMKGALKKSVAVGWMGGSTQKDSSCSHSGTKACKHCTSHPQTCRHCSGHKKSFINNDFIAPELDFGSAMQELQNKTHILNGLADENFGLALLHGHSDEFTFTKLPIGYVSVISNGVTSFRKKSEVELDPTFVPNTWRSINGLIDIAGGYSDM